MFCGFVLGLLLLVGGFVLRLLCYFVFGWFELVVSLVGLLFALGGVVWGVWVICLEVVVGWVAVMGWLLFYGFGFGFGVLVCFGLVFCLMCYWFGVYLVFSVWFWCLCYF